MSMAICEVCHEVFHRTGGVKNYPYVPRICSKECFVRLLEQRIPEGYTKVPKSYTESMVRWDKRDLEMRSNYERGIASWLRDNNITFFYEPYLFYVGRYRGYVPDFFLPYSNSFIEVKGKWEGNAFSKFKEFRHTFNHCIYLIDKDFMSRIHCVARKEFVW